MCVCVCVSNPTTTLQMMSIKGQFCQEGELLDGAFHLKASHETKEMTTGIALELCDETTIISRAGSLLQ